MMRAGGYDGEHQLNHVQNVFRDPVRSIDVRSRGRSLASVSGRTADPPQPRLPWGRRAGASQESSVAHYTQQMVRGPVNQDHQRGRNHVLATKTHAA